MNTIIKIRNFTDFTLTRDSGNRTYEKIKLFLTNNQSHQIPEIEQAIDSLIIDFENIEDVSVSFIQATVFRLADEYQKVELKNINNAIQFKIKTLLKITTIDQVILKKVVNLPIKSL
jgi:hypothetical protein